MSISETNQPSTSSSYRYDPVGEKDAEKEKYSERNEDPSTQRQISRFREILPQVLCVTAKNLVLLDLGMTLAFSTIVVPVLLNKRDPSGLSFTESQATWFASLPMIFQPFGSALSGLISGPFGRKRSLMLVNIPQIIGWLLLHSTNSVKIMYLAAALQGLGAGFMDAPILTYVGEICEPSLRGVLISYSLQFCSAGFFFQCLLGSITNWRNVALISTIFPTMAFLCISQIPETPMWLLSKNRVEDAEKSLRWLRGWVSKEEVAEEFGQLRACSNNSKYRRDRDTRDDGGKVPPDYSSGERRTILVPPPPPCNAGCVRPPMIEATETDDEYSSLTFLEKVKDLLRPEILKPMTVIVVMNFLYLTSGFPAFKTYMVLVFQRINIPMNANWASVCVSATIIAGHIVVMLAVKITGKRPLALATTFIAAVFGLAIAIHINFQSFFGELLGANANWLLFAYFLILTLAVSSGMGPVPWMLMSEIFPFRGRSFASGICAAVYYVTSFFSSKTFLSTLNVLGISGSYYLFGTISALGFCYVYLYLPETEGKSLEEIESIYKRRRREVIVDQRQRCTL